MMNKKMKKTWYKDNDDQFDCKKIDIVINKKIYRIVKEEIKSA